MARAKWLLAARPEQITPQGDWRIWLVMAGRGWGKTLTGAQDLAYHALWNDGARLAVIAPTHADARDTCVEGPSGLLSVLPRECIASWNRSLSELNLKNGSKFKLFSADEPERLRGPQFHRAWADELAAWKSPQAFDQLMMGLRLGKHPQLVITTTPKPISIIKDLVKRVGKDLFLTRGRSEENAGNLAPQVLADLRERYGGTRLGRQELDAEIVEDMEGALWSHAALDAARIADIPDTLERIVIAIDPAVTSHSKSDETGLVAAGRSTDGKFYILADASGQMTPDGWARRAISLRDELGADLIIGEVNEGGDLIERMLRLADPYVSYKAVRATKAKAVRAFPVAALYERGIVHHVGMLSALEDQMCKFTGQGLKDGSPDRVDAMVWAMTELMQGTHHAPRVRKLNF